MRLHRRAAALRNAGVCSGGTFVKFRELLVSGRQPECEVCRDWMLQNSITVDQIQEMLLQPEEVPPVPEQQDVNAAGPDADQEGNLLAPQKHRESKADIRKACLEYLNGLPHIEPVDGPVLKYHCKLCSKWRGKDGKANKLGTNCSLNTVRRFVGDHLRSQGHVKALAALNSGAPEDAREQDAGAVADDPEALKCYGYCVSNPGSTGALNFVLGSFPVLTDRVI